MTSICRRGVAFVLLLLLTGAPAVGATCLAWCAAGGGTDDPPAHGDHHASHCAEQLPAAGASLDAQGTALHDCAHPDAAHLAGILALASARSDAGLIEAPAVQTAASPAWSAAPTAPVPASARSPLRPPSPPTSRVLRI